MRGLIWNDLYNIGHNAKQMLLIVVIWGFCFYKGASEGSYLLLFSILFGMMTVTTFAFDEKCCWTKYCMILPIEKRDYVLAKYMVNIIFSIMGCLTGIVLTAAITIIQGSLSGEKILKFAVNGISLALLLGSVFIPLLLKYGAEKARVIMLGVIALPVLLGFLLNRITGTFWEDAWMVISRGGAYTLLIFALLVMGITMVISIHIFEKKEF